MPAFPFAHPQVSLDGWSSAGRYLQGWPGSGGRGQNSEAIGKDQEGCRTGTGGVQLEKEAAPLLEAQLSRSVLGTQRCLLGP